MTNLLLVTVVIVALIYGVSSGLLSSPWGVIIGILLAALILK